MGFDELRQTLRFHLTGPRLVVIAFAVMIALGTALLLLPFCQPAGAEPLSLVDAIFTSTSAVCVTGLTVRDTQHDFSPAGQAVILLLIQAGGLGILSFSNFVLLLTSRRLGLRERGVMEEAFGMLPYIKTSRLLRNIMIYTFTVEAFGAALLTARFWMEYSFGKALWLGIFHSVSAFCNAGFALFSNSFVEYQDDGYINAVMMGLIILGGLGFLVYADLEHRLASLTKRTNKPVRLSLHTRVVLLTSGLLIVFGATLFWLMEWTSVAGSAQGDKLLLHSMFLSVTARTAGFNTVDLSGLTNATLMVVMVLMVIGAAPGSTGGGVKVTTLAALFSLVRSRLRARPGVEVLNRSLPLEVIGKALAALMGFVLTVLVALILLEWTEVANIPHNQAGGRFLEHLFEVVSATGTVGLSLGVTPTLSSAGKLVLTACMFLGRLGPLLVGASLIGRQQTVPYTLPREKLMIG